MGTNTLGRNITLPIYNAGGKPSVGLKKRRISEANMFLGNDVYRLDSNNNIVKNNRV